MFWCPNAEKYKIGHRLNGNSLNTVGNTVNLSHYIQNEEQKQKFNNRKFTSNELRLDKNVDFINNQEEDIGVISSPPLSFDEFQKIVQDTKIKSMNHVPHFPMKNSDFYKGGINNTSEEEMTRLITKNKKVLQYFWKKNPNAVPPFSLYFTDEKLEEFQNNYHLRPSRHSFLRSKKHNYLAHMIVYFELLDSIDEKWAYLFYTLDHSSSTFTIKDKNDENDDILILSSKDNNESSMPFFKNPQMDSISRKELKNLKRSLTTFRFEALKLWNKHAYNPDLNKVHFYCNPDVVKLEKFAIKSNVVIDEEKLSANRMYFTEAEIQLRNEWRIKEHEIVKNKKSKYLHKLEKLFVKTFFSTSPMIVKNESTNNKNVLSIKEKTHILHDYFLPPIDKQPEWFTFLEQKQATIVIMNEHLTWVKQHIVEKNVFFYQGSYSSFLREQQHKTQERLKQESPSNDTEKTNIGGRYFIPGRIEEEFGNIHVYDTWTTLTILICGTKFIFSLSEAIRKCVNHIIRWGKFRSLEYKLRMDNNHFTTHAKKSVSNLAASFVNYYCDILSASLSMFIRGQTNTDREQDFANQARDLTKNWIKTKNSENPFDELVTGFVNVNKVFQKAKFKDRSDSPTALVFGEKFNFFRKILPYVLLAVTIGDYLFPNAFDNYLKLGDYTPYLYKPLMVGLQLTGYGSILKWFYQTIRDIPIREEEPMQTEKEPQLDKEPLLIQRNSLSIESSTNSGLLSPHVFKALEKKIHPNVMEIVKERLEFRNVSTEVGLGALCYEYMDMEKHPKTYDDDTGKNVVFGTMELTRRTNETCFTNYLNQTSNTVSSSEPSRILPKAPFQDEKSYENISATNNISPRSDLEEAIMIIGKLNTQLVQITKNFTANEWKVLAIIRDRNPEYADMMLRPIFNQIISETIIANEDFGNKLFSKETLTYTPKDKEIIKKKLIAQFNTTKSSNIKDEESEKIAQFFEKDIFDMPLILNLSFICNMNHNWLNNSVYVPKINENLTKIEVMIENNAIKLPNLTKTSFPKLDLGFKYTSAAKKYVQSSKKNIVLYSVQEEEDDNDEKLDNQGVQNINDKMIVHTIEDRSVNEKIIAYIENYATTWNLAFLMFLHRLNVVNTCYDGFDYASINLNACQEAVNSDPDEIITSPEKIFNPYIYETDDYEKKTYGSLFILRAFVKFGLFNSTPINDQVIDDKNRIHCPRNEKIHSALKTYIDLLFNLEDQTNYTMILPDETLFNLVLDAMDTVDKYRPFYLNFHNSIVETDMKNHYDVTYGANHIESLNYLKNFFPQLKNTFEKAGLDTTSKFIKIKLTHKSPDRDSFAYKETLSLGYLHQQYNIQGLLGGQKYLERSEALEDQLNNWTKPIRIAFQLLNTHKGISLIEQYNKDNIKKPEPGSNTKPKTKSSSPPRESSSSSSQSQKPPPPPEKTSLFFSQSQKSPPPEKASSGPPPEPPLSPETASSEPLKYTNTMPIFKHSLDKQLGEEIDAIEHLLYETFTSPQRDIPSDINSVLPNIRTIFNQRKTQLDNKDKEIQFNLLQHEVQNMVNFLRDLRDPKADVTSEEKIQTLFPQLMNDNLMTDDIIRGLKGLIKILNKVKIQGKREESKTNLLYTLEQFSRISLENLFGGVKKGVLEYFSANKDNNNQTKNKKNSKPDKKRENTNFGIFGGKFNTVDNARMNIYNVHTETQVPKKHVGFLSFWLNLGRDIMDVPMLPFITSLSDAVLATVFFQNLYAPFAHEPHSNGSLTVWYNNDYSVNPFITTSIIALFMTAHGLIYGKYTKNMNWVEENRYFTRGTLAVFSWLIDMASSVFFYSLMVNPFTIPESLFVQAGFATIGIMGTYLIGLKPIMEYLSCMAIASAFKDSITLANVFSSFSGSLELTNVGLPFQNLTNLQSVYPTNPDHVDGADFLVNDIYHNWNGFLTFSPVITACKLVIGLISRDLSMSISYSNENETNQILMKIPKAAKFNFSPIILGLIPLLYKYMKSEDNFTIQIKKFFSSFLPAWKAIGNAKSSEDLKIDKFFEQQNTLVPEFDSKEVQDTLLDIIRTSPFDDTIVENLKQGYQLLGKTHINSNDITFLKAEYATVFTNVKKTGRLSFADHLILQDLEKTFKVLNTVLKRQ